MSTAPSRRAKPQAAPPPPAANGASLAANIPLLANGDRMPQPEFHRRYQACPEDEKYELVGGIVFMTSPLTLLHSRFDGELGFGLELYRRATPGVEVLHGATAILGEESEPQPDLGLRVLWEYGGRSRETTDHFLEGSPELLAEVAYSSRALDLHGKRDDYRRAGVIEYVVVSVEDRQIHWFDFPRDRLLRPTRDGVYRSRVFPGLWIDGPGLLELNSARVEAVVRQGLAGRAHAAFVKRLEAARRRA